MIGAGVSAMSDSSSGNQVPPYGGGASISKVFYPADGSTMTITCTGAVIKQSPGGTPYRQGWVNPANIGNINSTSDLKGQIASGSSNPFGTSNSCPSSGNSQNQSGNNNNNQNNNMNNNVPTPSPQTPNPSSTSSANATSNATANATVNLTGSGSPANETSQTSANPAPANANTSSSAPAQNENNSFSGKSLPNTGPGDVLAIGGLATVLGTIGHFIFQRLRYRSLV